MAVNRVSTLSISLEDIASACRYIGNLMGALSDQNSLAIIVSCSGKVTFTNQASTVLAETHFDHPLQKLIINAVNHHHNETADDCKDFLLLLHEIVIAINNLSQFQEIEIRNTLSNEIFRFSSLLPGVFGHIKGSQAVVSNPVLDCDVFVGELQGIVLTFFQSKFPLFIAKDVSKLMCDFIFKTFSDWSSINYLSFLIEHFDVFCSKIICHPSKSMILKGFVLKQNLRSLNYELKDAYFIVVWELFEETKDFVWGIGEKSISSGLNHTWISEKKILTTLKSHRISTILTPGVVSDNMKIFFHKNDICVLNLIEKEEVNAILLFCNVVPLNLLNDPIQSDNVGSLQSIKSVCNGIDSFIHLETTSETGAFSPHHILLGAAVDDLWNEYYKECCNCLKLIKQWLCMDNKYSFERTNHTGINKCTYELEPVKNHVNVQNIGNAIVLNKFCFTTNSTKNMIENFPIGVSLPLGIFEFSLMVGLKTLDDRSILTVKNLYSILETALLKFICKRWGIPVTGFEGEKSFGQFIAKMKCCVTNPVVPLVSKEIQIYKILSLLQQLLRIDAIISTK